MYLLVVRHAIAHERDPARWPDDSLRPLTAEGEERFRRAARGLARISDPPARVLASGWARAWRTAELLADEAGWPAPERCVELEGYHDPVAAARVVRSLPGPSAGLVGHEPGLSELAALLLGGPGHRPALELRKGGAVLLTLPGGGGPAILRWHATPRMLRGLAR